MNRTDVRRTNRPKYENNAHVARIDECRHEMRCSENTIEIFRSIRYASWLRALHGMVYFLQPLLFLLTVADRFEHGKWNACMKSKRSVADALETHTRFFRCCSVWLSAVINCSMNTITNTQTINDAHMCSSHESIMKLKRSCRVKVFFFSFSRANNNNEK